MPVLESQQPSNATGLIFSYSSPVLRARMEGGGYSSFNHTPCILGPQRLYLDPDVSERNLRAALMYSLLSRDPLWPPGQQRLPTMQSALAPPPLLETQSSDGGELLRHLHACWGGP